jgi:hypothetical protein
MQSDQLLPEPLKVTLQVTRVLEELHIPYFIGGSMASAIHGTIRSTVDTDLVVDLNLEHVQPFVASLEPYFYVDQLAIINALHTGSSFNLIHQETMFKVDIFPLAKNLFVQNQMRRRVLQRLSNHPKDQAYFTTAEDIILAKLSWFRMGGEISERQWLDVMGVMRVQDKQLDIEYLRQWAEYLNLADLLERAILEARG